MKLLLFSDLHNDTEAAQSLVKRARNVDVVIGAGDFCNARRNLRLCIDVLRAIDRPVVLVAGNNESTEELREACRQWPSAHVLHGNGVAISGVEFYGLGGGIPVTPFGSWSYDFTEEEAVGLLTGCPAGCVLVSHSPPKGMLDANSSGRSLGSVAVRDAILRLKPVLVVCGHIHEWHVDLCKSKGRSDIGKAGLSWEDGSWQPFPHRQGGPRCAILPELPFVIR